MPNTNTLRVRLKADLTAAQGIASITDLIDTIDGHSALRETHFGIDVREGLVSMRVRLYDGAFFSAGMEVALANWGNGIGKWIDPPKGRLDS